MVTYQLQFERRTGKVYCPKIDVLLLCHATKLLEQSWSNLTGINTSPCWRLDLGGQVTAGHRGGESIHASLKSIYRVSQKKQYTWVLIITLVNVVREVKVIWQMESDSERIFRIISVSDFFCQITLTACLQDRCSSWRPTNHVKALKASEDCLISWFLWSCMCVCSLDAAIVDAV